MHLNRLPSIRGLFRGFRPAPAAFAVMLALPVTLPPLRAAGPDASPVAAPPAYPQAVHVFNGCHLSTVIYLARFLREFPAETGQPLVLEMNNQDGSRKPHTVSLITWQHQWWFRDEYFGVCPTGIPAGTAADLRRVTDRAESILNRHFQKQMRNRHIEHPPVVPEELSAAQMQRDVETAAAFLPYPASVYWVKDGHREIPFAFFRPAAGQIAVYNPASGTCVADCASPNVVGIVRAVARELGYRADVVRPALNVTAATFVAANLPSAGLAQ